MTRFTACFVAPALLACCTALPALAQGTDYASADWDYQCTYPEGWEANTEFNAQVDVMLFSPMQDDTPMVRENVNIIAQPPSPEFDNLQAIEQQLPAILNTEILESEVIDVPGLSTQALRVEFEMTQPDGNTTLRLVQYYMGNDEVSLIVTGTAAQDSFGSYESEFDAIVSSLSPKE